MTLPLELSDRATEKNQLQYMLRWLIICCFGVTPFYLLLAYLFDVPLVAGLAFGVLLLGCLLFIAQRLAKQGRITQSVLLICNALNALVLMIMVLIPAMVPVLIVCPILSAVLALQYLDQRFLRVIIAGSLVYAQIIVVLGEFVHLFDPLPPVAVHAIRLVITPIALGIVFLLLGQLRGRLTASLDEMRASNLALREAKQGLDAQVASQTADLQAALAAVRSQASEQARLLAENTQQREMIYEMSVPVLPITHDTLVMPLIGALDSQRLQQAQDHALRQLQQTSARRLVLDITGVPVVDTQVAQGLIVTVEAARLLGTSVVLVGIRPEVAQAMVGLGLDLHGVRTASNLQSALRNGDQ